MRRRLIVGAAILAAALGATAGIVLAAAVNVGVGNHYFEDATVGDGVVTAKVGDQLRLTAVDTGTDGRPHTADVDALNIHSGGLTPGSVYVSPVITQPGTFVLYCKVHLRSQNHQTTLVVTGTAVTPTPTPAPSRATPAPTAARTPTPAPTAAPGAAGSSVAPGSVRPSESAGAVGASAASSSGLVPSGPGTLGAGASTAPEASRGGADGILPTGVTGGMASDWARSVRLGFVLLLPILTLAVFAARRARARALGAAVAPSDPRAQARRRV